MLFLHMKPLVAWTPRSRGKILRSKFDVVPCDTFPPPFGETAEEGGWQRLAVGGWVGANLVRAGSSAWVVGGAGGLT